MATGYLLDQYLGDGCYTWREAVFDGLLGAGGYGLFKALGLAAKGKNVAPPMVTATAPRGPANAIKEAVEAARAAGANPMAVGNAAHKALEKFVRTKPGWAAEQTRTIGGKTIRPDALTPRGRAIDLKPATASGMKSGAAKKRKYEELGIPTRIIYY